MIEYWSVECGETTMHAFDLKEALAYSLRLRDILDAPVYLYPIP